MERVCPGPWPPRVGGILEQGIESDWPFLRLLPLRQSEEFQVRVAGHGPPSGCVCRCFVIKLWGRRREISSHLRNRHAGCEHAASEGLLCFRQVPGSPQWGECPEQKRALCLYPARWSLQAPAEGEGAQFGGLGWELRHRPRTARNPGNLTVSPPVHPQSPCSCHGRM